MVERLAQLALFADLSWPQLEAITHAFEEQVFAADQRVLRRGLAGSGFYVVIEGSAVVDWRRAFVRLPSGLPSTSVTAAGGKAPRATASRSS